LRFRLDFPGKTADPTTTQLALSNSFAFDATDKARQHWNVAPCPGAAYRTLLRSAAGALVALIDCGGEKMGSKSCPVGMELCADLSWASIYERTSSQLPGFPSSRDVANGASERGKEKKHRLLNYLRDHPEELRPASP
jgi:hypothetical protein